MSTPGLNLVRAEWSRFFARRFTRIMILFILALFGAIAIGYAANTAPITPEAIAQARAQAQAQIDEQIRYMEAEYQRCLNGQAAGEGKDFPPGFNCEDLRYKGLGFSVDEYAQSMLPHQFRFVPESDGVLYLAAAILCMFAFVVGASFVGAEWTSGGLTNLLLWRPRRLPLLATKLGTGLAGIFVVSVGALVFWLGTLWTIAVTRGSTAGATSGFWQSIALSSLRVLGLTLAAAAVGFALASLGRHTAMALGCFIGYLLVVELGARIVFSAINVAFPERFTLMPYVVGWMGKKYVLYDYDVCRFSFDVCEPTRYVITWSTAAMVIGLLAAALVGGAMVAFRRRDVA
jgi:hypothetical protein